MPGVTSQVRLGDKEIVPWLPFDIWAESAFPAKVQAFVRSLVWSYTCYSPGFRIERSEDMKQSASQASKSSRHERTAPLAAPDFFTVATDSIKRDHCR